MGQDSENRAADWIGSAGQDAESRSTDQAREGDQSGTGGRV